IKNIVKFRFSLCVRTFSLALHLFLFIPEIANDMYKAIIKQKDLDDSSLAAIVSIAESSEGIHSDERQIATEVKQAVESKLTGTWQVVVGRTFGSCVHHEDGCFAYLYVGRHAYLIWRSPLLQNTGTTTEGA
uniref:Dynein light chain n=1 Tax=Romanomermis culicivorax TaxID=13658 RepID=A0A915KAV8_ROMCU